MTTAAIPGRLTRTDGLCTSCHLPDPWSTTVYVLGEHIEPVGPITICGECREVQ